MLIKSYGSSSAGSSYLIDDGSSRIIIDCGVKSDTRNVDAVLITHGHGDHYKYYKDYSNYNIPIYLTEETATAIKINGYNKEIIEPLELFNTGGYSVLPFETEHDCPGAVGYLIKSNSTKETLLFATDTYYIKYNFPKINYFMLECNYDIVTLKNNLENNIIPFVFYKRLLKSHFSIDNLIEFLRSQDLSEAKEIYLMHTSRTNGSPQEFRARIEKRFNVKTYVFKEAK